MSGQQYSMQDISRLFNDATGGDGIFSNTILSQPSPSYSYDSTVTQAQINNRLLFNKYFAPMTRNVVAARQRALGRATGLGSAVSKALSTAMDLSPSLGMNAIQHFGGEQAISALLEMGNGMAAARGQSHGGMMSPQQLAANTRFAASQGALAYRNNFNINGSVNLQQTHGLNLAAAGMISGMALSDKSQYAEWARRMHGKGSSLSRDELELQPEEIDNFKNGVGTTAKAERSFNKQIKTFTEEINKFVSSVSKMTGDYSSAIEFLQKSTGGKLFSAGEDAARAREKASRTAINMRVIAADAGVSGQEMMAMAHYFGKVVGTEAFGIDSRYNRGASISNLGNLMAAAQARWMNNHPYVTPEQQEQARLGLQDQLEDYATGDMYKMNAVAAYLADTKQINGKQVSDLIRRGDANQLFKFLSNNYGGDENVRRLMNDAKWVERMRVNHSATVMGFDEDSIARGGMANEALIAGSRKIMGRLTKNAAVELTTERDKKIKELGAQAGFDVKSVFTNEKALQNAGMSQEKIDAFKRDIEGHDLSEEDMLSRISDFGGNTTKIKKSIDTGRKTAVEIKFGKGSKEAAMFKGPKTQQEYQKKLKEMETAALLNIDNLKAAGLDSNQAEWIKKLAKEKGWTASKIRSEVNKRGGNVGILELYARDEFIEKAYEEFGEDSESVKRLDDEYTRMRGEKSLSDIRKEAYGNVLSKSRESAIGKAKASGDGSKLYELALQGVTGKNGFKFNNKDYVENLFSMNLNAQNKNKSPEAQNGLVSKAMGIYESAINRGKTQEEAFKLVTANMGSQFKDDFLSADSRKAALDRTISDNASGTLAKKISDVLGAGLSTDQLETKTKELNSKVVELRKKNPTASDEYLRAEALNQVFAKEISGAKKANRDVAVGLINGLKSKDKDNELMGIMQKSESDLYNLGLGVDNSAIARNVQNNYSGTDSENAERLAKEIGGTTQSVKEALNRETLKLANSTDASGTSAQAIKDNSANGYWRAFNKAEVTQIIEDADKALNDLSTPRIVGKADAEDAKRRNKVPGTFLSENLKDIEKTFNVDSKMKAIDSTRERLKGLGVNFGAAENNKGGTSSKDIAAEFAKFNEKYGELNPAEYEKKFKELYSRGNYSKVYSSFKDLEASSGISIKDAVSTYAAGNNVSDESKRAQAEKFGYIASHSKGGAPELGKDNEMVLELQKLITAVEEVKASLDKAAAKL